MLESVLNKKLTQFIFLSLGIIILAIPFIGSFFERVDLDTAVIMTEMERVAEGYVPYKTLHLNYPPILFYCFSFIKLLFGVPYGCLAFYRCVNILLVCLSGMVIFLFCKKLCSHSTISFFCIWLYLLSVLFSDGNFVIFESLSVFTGLWSLFLCWTCTEHSQFKYVAVGILAALSFLVKQFGLGYFVLNILCVGVLLNKGRFAKLTLIIIGFLIPVSICYLIWKESIFQSILFNGYGTETAALSGGETSLCGKMKQIWNNLSFFCLERFPFMVMIFFVIPNIIKMEKWKELTILALGLLIFSLQFYFVKEGLHYYLYMIPFAVLLTALVLSIDLSIIFKYISHVCLAYTVVVVLLGVFYSHVYVPFSKKQLLEDQYNSSNQLLKVIDNRQSKVWIVNTNIEYLYYFNNLMVPNIGTIGYATGPLEVTIEKQRKQIEDADVVLVSMNEVAPYSFTEEINDYLNCFPRDTVGKNIIVYYKTLKNTVLY